MIRTVVKRDGSKEAFSAEKITLSVTKTGAPDVVAKRIAQEIRVSPDLKENTTSADIRAAVLIRLQQIDLDWDHAWRQYEHEVKKRATRGKP
jgi:transcriptional regulator NrdR family protein